VRTPRHARHHRSAPSEIDRWLRKQPPRIELALRYSIRARFRIGDRAMTARIDELFGVIKPSEDEYAAIVRRACEIGQAMDGQIGLAKPTARQP